MGKMIDAQSIVVASVATNYIGGRRDPVTFSGTACRWPR
jgi:L-lactate permease